MSRFDVISDLFRHTFSSILHRGSTEKASPRIRRYLNRRSYLRIDVVNRLGIEQGRVTEAVSPEEMAAVVLLCCDVLPFSDRSERLAEAIRDGWFDHIGDRFYRAVATMSREVDIIGSPGHTHGMLKLGSLAARILGANDWANRLESPHATPTHPRPHQGR